MNELSPRWDYMFFPEALEWSHDGGVRRDPRIGIAETALDGKAFEVVA